MSFKTAATQYAKMLENLSGCLDKGIAYAGEKKFDPAVLLNARLAPDQFNLTRQIQIACDNAKNGISRLAGKEAPVHADNEQSAAELQHRIRAVVEYLGGFSEADFAEAADRHISLPYWGGRFMTGADYLNEYLTPNFLFHVTTAYSIFRHNGVPVGKMDFLGRLPLQSPKQS